ncbi:MarR family winged helix-turn-helix transcriptional regulator [Brevibacterium linens]|uniref:Transcriptional regulator, MarR family n=2 Tax=Brevibacterium linens TaxID=1703 RepID=A0A2H1HJQ7_BRELN|nr:MarR family transcriptional regulator [Brevibacterium linens]AZU01005.1 MarR family transcriptional regulator [Brevibacterium linens]KAB1949483.1 MarR family transcriptional regulator [Brevibacterium linens ATCC 9172]SMX62794.1 transcriptional regulator, MarR family [Brevibacterium linens ATCC 9172]SMX63125.1 transcriptional regulator, MarR family [Brevibacterium linens]
MLESQRSTEQLDNPLALEAQICFALAVASRGVIGAYRSVLEPLGLTHPQYLVMLALWQRERLPVREIARLLRLEPATVSPLVKRLEALDYVTKTRSGSDERIVEVTLTATGRELRRTAEAIPGTMMAKLGMDVDGVRELHAVMQKIIASVDAAAEADD